MAITNAFREAVSSGNVKGIRIMMKDSLLVDPSFSEFNEMSKLASGVSGLYDPHDGRAFQSDVLTWDNDYMDKLMVQVVGNFSRERLEHLQAVVRHLRPAAQTSQTKPHTQSAASRGPENHSQPSQSSYQEQKNRDTQNGSGREVKVVGGALAGAVVGGVIAALASATVLGGAAIGAVVGGVATVVLTKGE